MQIHKPCLIVLIQEKVDGSCENGTISRPIANALFAAFVLSRPSSPENEAPESKATTPRPTSTVYPDELEYAVRPARRRTSGPRKTVVTSDDEGPEVAESLVIPQPIHRTDDPTMDVVVNSKPGNTYCYFQPRLMLMPICRGTSFRGAGFIN